MTSASTEHDYADKEWLREKKRLRWILLVALVWTASIAGGLWMVRP